MKLAFSTNAYLKFSFADTVRRLARIGYAGVEIMADEIGRASCRERV